jgi:hypothetical protein
MSGKTKKNSKVVIKLNGKEVGDTKTDETGIYVFKLTGVSQSSNLLTASILDGTDTVIGTVDTQFNFAGKMPAYYNTSIQPGLTVTPGSSITITIDAEPGLTSVTVGIDGTSMPAAESSPGKYSVTTVAPAKVGVYPLLVTMKNILSQTTNKPEAATLVVSGSSTNTGSVSTGTNVSTGTIATGAVTPPKPQFKNVTITQEGNKVNLNFSLENMPSTTNKFRIAYGESPNALTSEVTTLTLDKITRTNGTYNWYIPNLPAKNYTFKIFGLAADGTLVSEVVSDPVNITVGKQGSCSIGNVTSVMATTYTDKTMLSWDPLPNAVSYNVYRINASKDMELVKNVTETTYTINLAPGTASYEDFAVKALCDSTTESITPAIASRVRTGPGALAIIVILAALGSVLLMRRKMI